ncbi:DUF6503 family protein [Winogradskyella maritima]|uniref:DUF6503 family protein n=1 Tax=Winogradskyella maritima TaxID=1517766 RepID=A0ABV8AHW9_9FLAO|nr:DUF6503 family protein [Winogradskyella maritima]
MKIFVLAFILFVGSIGQSQTLTGTQVLEKAIAYHDPNGNWATFNGGLTVVMTTPNRSPRTSRITINLPSEYFKVDATRDSETTSYELNKGQCQMFANGTLLSEDDAKVKKMTCERGDFMKNYYTYLYGLPMKLNDPGTNIDPKVERKFFKGKDYLVLKATYDEAVGSDAWYFYFNPETYAMEIYQFYRIDDNGQPKLDTGEYILLTEETTINDIKMPKVRAWYYNKNDEYLGTDTLQ